MEAVKREVRESKEEIKEEIMEAVKREVRECKEELTE